MELFSTNTESDLYFLTVNTVGFSKSLRKSNIEIQKGEQLVAMIVGMNEIFGRALNYEINRDEALEKCRKLGKQAYQLILSIECTEKLLAHEKADLVVAISDFLKLFHE